MDTVHDLGGMQGFGPIPGITEDDTVEFSEEWKARIWAIAMMSMTKLRKDQTGWTLDWYRHVLERVPPDLYLRSDYFEKWILAMMTTAVDEGVADVHEFVKSRSDSQGFDYAVPVPVSDAFAADARFKPGDRVMTRRNIGTMHTRLAGYVRGRPGVIESRTGVQPLPDDSAVGTIRNEQVYVVRFAMADLWPESSESRDSLLIDLWDSYLEPV